jgi:hypothetical protein
VSACLPFVVVRSTFTTSPADRLAFILVFVFGQIQPSEHTEIKSKKKEELEELVEAKAKLWRREPERTGR